MGEVLPIMKCSECGVPVFGMASLATGLPPVCPKCFNELRRKPRPEVEKPDASDGHDHLIGGRVERDDE